ncbi:BACON domain-containing protein [Parabacteroides chinchillae]|uniref:Binding domain-containing protein, N-terminal n=1 Tax=Parabacteroides chinchillae TaxID=871327 RepID=A0A8G2BXL5_9BACT|nr:BACON domain-containing carbohydrate-binding protein [Parabacteroides chinchillae]SEG06176.1 Putative binding domain-containing protein, N-terminal [Parabacteroides chinchillae]
MKRQSLQALPVLALLLLWLAGGCTGTEVEGEEPVLPSGSILSVQIPAGVIPLQTVTPVDTKSVGVAGCEADSLSNDRGFPLAQTPADSLPDVTRASQPTYARAIVLQYKGGTLQNTGKTDIDNYTIGNSISAKLVAGEGCNVYVLVVNETATSGGDAAFATESGLKTATYDLYAKFPSPTDNDIPLAGALTGVNVVRLTVDGAESGLIQQSGSQDVVRVQLKRIAACLKLDFRYGLKGYLADANSGKIMNVPQSMPLIEPAGDTCPDESAPFGSISFTLTDCDGDNDDQPATSVVRYVPANKRGSAPGISRPSDKYGANAPSAKCTYIAFTAKEKANPAHMLTYSFYLGANNTTDFNIERNTVYTLNSTISQGAGGDNRVTEAGLMPELHTDPLVQSITSTGATLRGTLSNQGNLTEYGFYYKAETSFEGASGATKLASANLSGGSFTASLTGLTAKKVYYFRSYAVSGGQTLYGELASFSTNADGAPVLTTLVAPVSATDGRSAASSGNAVANATAWGIVYALTTGLQPAQGQGTRQAGSGNAVTLTPLTPGTDYYYYHYASNAQGYVYSSAEKSFRTKNYPATPTAASVTSTEVNKLKFQGTLPERLNAVDDYPATAGVKLWTSNPGALSPSAAVPTPSAGLAFASPATPGAKTVDWTAMTAGQTYYYAVYSTNGVGTVYHAASAPSFTASAALPDPSPKTKTVGPQPATGAFTITTTGRNTNAAVAGSAVTVASGNGTTSKSITVVANTTAGQRSSTLTFTTVGELPLRSNTATVTQYGVVFPASFGNVTDVSKDGKAATSVPVTANIPWQATSNAAWCTIDGSSQTGSTHTGANTQTGSDQNFTYTVAKNEGTSRTATVTVKGTGSFTGFSKTFTVAQLSGTWLNIDKTNMTTGPQASSHALAITSNTSWTLASSNTSVATVGTASGTNNANPAISLKDYTTAGSSRTATITVTPTESDKKSYTITQYGVVFPASFGNVTGVSKDGKAATSVSVTANIPWQATSNASWCTIANGSQTGDNTQAGSAKSFTYTVAQNTGVARTATITVKGTGSFTGFTQTFTVAQLAGGQINIKPGDPGSDNSDIDFTAPVLTINQALADVYKNKESNLTTYPPFNYDGGASSGTTGSDRNGVSSSCTLTKEYSIEVEKTERGTTISSYVVAIDYCKGLGTGWRVPTIIELKGMYDNRATLQSAGCAAFISNVYWSSSVYGGNADRRCVLYFFTIDSFSWGGTTGYNYYVRCVRDI